MIAFLFSFSQDLVTNGAQVSICNKYGETPLDKAKPHLRELLRGTLALLFSYFSSILTSLLTGLL